MSSMRIGGLASGMDIDSLVEKLMTAERTPLDKLEQKKQIYEWQRDAYRDVNTKLQTLDTYIADNLILKSLITKTAATSNSEYVGVTATGSANGSISIEGVSQLAVAARAVGEQVSAVGSTKMTDLIGSPGTIKISAIKSDGTMPTTATAIEITPDMTVNQFVNKVNSSGAGISLIFENGRFSMSAKNTGDNKAGDEIQIDSSSDAIFASLGFVKDAGGSYQTSDGKNAIFQVNGIATERSTNNFTISGYSITLKKTFNHTRTIAEKYLAAREEEQLAAQNLADKNSAHTTAKSTYYGSDTTTPPGYTADHNNAYTAAFGNTLNLTQLESYSKLGGAFWKGLTDPEVSFLGGQVGKTYEEFKSAIGTSGLDTESQNKLNAITEDSFKSISSLSGEAEINSFREQATYATYGTKLKDFYVLDQTVIQGFTYNSDDTLDQIRQKIDAYDGFAGVEDALKSISNVEDLKYLLEAAPETLTSYKAKSDSDVLKSKYNTIGDSFYKGLIDSEISELNGKDLTQSTERDQLSPELQAKLEGFTTTKLEALSGLSTDQLTKFRTLAVENVDRQNYKNAVAELEVAKIRDTNADNTLATATNDAISDGILNADGTINTEKNVLIQDPETGTIRINTEVVESLSDVQAVTLTSTTDVDAIMTRIKEFVNTYNGLIKDLNNLTKESIYRDYKPLTSTQRKEMEEKEIELWEERAKSGLLRSDSIIQAGLNSMRSLIYESNPEVVNTKFNTLFKIGITTSKNYIEGGTLEIDENKLRAALEEDPNSVATLFSNASGKKAVVENGVVVEPDTRGYLQKLRSSFDNIQVRIETRAGRSSMTQTQYTLGKYLKNVDNQMDQWQDRLVSIENRYWSQFSAMESMINKANNQSSMLMGQYY